MKICFVSPYIPKHVGGGERYLFDCARLAAENHQVTVAVPTPSTALTSDSELKKQMTKVRAQYEDFLGCSLAAVSFVPSPLCTSASFLTKLWWTRNFDVIYYATDGSLFFSLASRNILHIQVPLQQRKSILDRIKLLNWQVLNTNSEFTKNTIEEWWGVSVDVVHRPMAEIKQLKSIPQQLKKKKPVILHVGRFFTQLHAKRQDVLVEIFRDLRDQYPQLMKGWKLVLVGSVEDQAYADEVAAAAKDLPIEIHHQVSRTELWNWYDTASIYWHATGFGVDETRHPEKVEHFGISTLEAMSRGCVPVVINKGGQPEVLGPSLTGLLWSSKAECINTTQQLINHPAQTKQVAKLAIKRAAFFDQARFKTQLDEMLEGRVR